MPSPITSHPPKQKKESQNSNPHFSDSISLNRGGIASGLPGGRCGDGRAGIKDTLPEFFPILKSSPWASIIQTDQHTRQV